MGKAVQLIIEVDDTKNQHIKRKDNGLEVQASPFRRPVVFGKVCDAVLNDEIISEALGVKRDDLGYVLGECLRTNGIETNCRGRQVIVYREYFPVQFYRIT